jgi:hypothetical protein
VQKHLTFNLFRADFFNLLQRIRNQHRIMSLKTQMCIEYLWKKMPWIILVTVKLKAQRQLKNEEHIKQKKMCLISVKTPFSREWLRSFYPHLHILERCTTAQYTRSSYSTSICILGSEWFIWSYLMNQKQRSFVLRSEGRRGEGL